MSPDTEDSSCTASLYREGQARPAGPKHTAFISSPSPPCPQKGTETWVLAVNVFNELPNAEASLPGKRQGFDGQERSAVGVTEVLHQICT